MSPDVIAAVPDGMNPDVRLHQRGRAELEFLNAQRAALNPLRARVKARIEASPEAASWAEADEPEIERVTRDFVDLPADGDGLDLCRQRGEQACRQIANERGVAQHLERAPAGIGHSVVRSRKRADRIPHALNRRGSPPVARSTVAHSRGTAR